MNDHPYKSLPAEAFWRGAVAPDFVTDRLVAGDDPLLQPGDRIMSAGSCFAANMVPWLEGAGFEYVRTETPPPALATLPENLAYRHYSAGYGNVYTARQFRQLVERAAGLFRPAEDRWYADGAVVDPFRPGLAHPASTDQEFEDMTVCHLAAVRRAAEQATVLVFTLGLTETWASRQDGAVYPTCPGTVGGTYDEAKYQFVQQSVSEIVADMRAALWVLRMWNPDIRVILTVSPVPLVATAAGGHVLPATIYSKSVLRVAAQTLADEVDGVRYFPSYEIITGPQAPVEFFEEDRRSVTPAGVEAVMEVFLAACELPEPGSVAEADSAERPRVMRKLERKSRALGMSGESKSRTGRKPKADEDPADTLAASQAVSQALCDEELLATWAPKG
jgi:hypothetical protein